MNHLDHLYFGKYFTYREYGRVSSRNGSDNEWIQALFLQKNNFNFQTPLKSHIL